MRIIKITTDGRSDLALSNASRSILRLEHLMLYFDQQSTMCQGAYDEALTRSTRTRRGKTISTGCLRLTGCIHHVMACT